MSIQQQQQQQQQHESGKNTSTRRLRLQPRQPQHLAKRRRISLLRQKQHSQHPAPWSSENRQHVRLDRFASPMRAPRARKKTPTEHRAGPKTSTESKPSRIALSSRRSRRRRSCPLCNNLLGLPHVSRLSIPLYPFRRPTVRPRSPPATQSVRSSEVKWPEVLK